MRWVRICDKKLRIDDESAAAPLRGVGDALESIVARRAVNEFLFNPNAGGFVPFFPALHVARNGLAEVTRLARSSARSLVWVDSTHTFYPPAAVAMGIAVEQLRVLRPLREDVVSAALECMRCPGVGVVVALIHQPLTGVDVRRFQLAAERGGGVGLLLRPYGKDTHSHIHASATRWLVAPAPGERTVQRWRLQLIHGHGRQIGQTILLEKHRDTGQANFVHLPAPLVHRPPVSAAS